MDAREMTELDDAWARATAARWLAADPWGGVHLLWGGTECTQSPPGEPGDAACPDGLIHIAFDPDNMTTITATELASATPAQDPPRVPPTLAPSQGDHFHGIAFGPEHGVLAWTRDKGIDHTVVVPVAPNLQALA